MCIVRYGNYERADAAAKSRHPLEEGDPCLFGCLKRKDFTLLPDMAHLCGDYSQALSRLFALGIVHLRKRPSYS